ncbi:MAG: hypothetical protein K1X67_15230 [Fimbriimonadaceae bacterium]|nr:hypothetical protein [Fimbriimonadaceae bacterium]
MKQFIALLVLLLCIRAVFAQPNVISIGDVRLKVFTSSGDRELDQELRAEHRRIQTTFAVQTALLFFDDVESPNALATPRQLRPGTQGTILVGLNLASQTLTNPEQRGDALIGILAHEMAHIVQFASEIDYLSGTERERQADFLAGYYVAREKGRGRRIDLMRVADCMFAVGGGDHGSPRERAAMMLHGYRAGHLGVAQAVKLSVELIRRGAYQRLP